MVAPLHAPVGEWTRGTGRGIKPGATGGAMERRVAVSLLLAFASAARAEVSAEDFKVATTRNLINLCTVDESDPEAVAAVHFCHGFLVGAYRYHLASSGPGNPQLVCFPENPPSRDETIEAFVAWALAHPQYMTERPVDTEFRFLIETWPCAKK
jgi:hypothetical protein